MSKQIEKNQKALLTIRRKLLKLKQSPIYKEIKQLERQKLINGLCSTFI